MKKRLLSAILSFCMLLTMAPTVAFAAKNWPKDATGITVAGGVEGTTKSDSVWYKIDTGTKTLTIGGEGEIPDYAYQTTATNLHYNQADWYAEKDNIKHVVIKAGITRVGHLTITNMKNLESIEIKGEDVVLANGAVNNYQGNSNTLTITVPLSVYQQNKLGDEKWFESSSLYDNPTIEFAISDAEKIASKYKEVLNSYKIDNSDSWDKATISKITTAYEEYETLPEVVKSELNESVGKPLKALYDVAIQKRGWPDGAKGINIALEGFNGANGKIGISDTFWYLLDGNTLKLGGEGDFPYTGYDSSSATNGNLGFTRASWYNDRASITTVEVAKDVTSLDYLNLTNLYKCDDIYLRNPDITLKDGAVCGYAGDENRKLTLHMYKKAYDKKSSTWYITNGKTEAANGQDPDPTISYSFLEAEDFETKYADLWSLSVSLTEEQKEKIKAAYDEYQTMDTVIRNQLMNTDMLSNGQTYGAKLLELYSLTTDGTVGKFPSTNNIYYSYNKETQTLTLTYTGTGTGKIPDYTADKVPLANRSIKNVVVSGNISHIGAYALANHGDITVYAPLNTTLDANYAKGSTVNLIYSETQNFIDTYAQVWTLTGMVPARITVNGVDKNTAFTAVKNAVAAYKNLDPKVKTQLNEMKASNGSTYYWQLLKVTGADNLDNMTKISGGIPNGVDENGCFTYMDGIHWTLTKNDDGADTWTIRFDTDNGAKAALPDFGNSTSNTTATDFRNQPWYNNCLGDDFHNKITKTYLCKGITGIGKLGLAHFRYCTDFYFENPEGVDLAGYAFDYWGCFPTTFKPNVYLNSKSTLAVNWADDLNQGGDVDKNHTTADLNLIYTDALAFEQNKEFNGLWNMSDEEAKTEENTAVIKKAMDAYSALTEKAKAQLKKDKCSGTVTYADKLLALAKAIGQAGQVGDIQYTISGDGKTLTVSGSGALNAEMAESEWTAAKVSSIENLVLETPVTVNAGALKNMTALKNVNAVRGVKAIGDNVFPKKNNLVIYGYADVRNDSLESYAKANNIKFQLKELNILCIGNSHTEDYTTYMQSILNDVNADLDGTKVTFSRIVHGSRKIGLTQHYTGSNGKEVTNYSHESCIKDVVDKVNGSSTTSSNDVEGDYFKSLNPKDNTWDLIIIQDYRESCVGEETNANYVFIDHLHNAIQNLRTLQPTAQVAWFMDWLDTYDKDTSYENYSLNNYKLASENNVAGNPDFIVAGATFNRTALTSYLGSVNNLEDTKPLHTSDTTKVSQLWRDGTHMSYETGRYLAGASVAAKVLTDVFSKEITFKDGTDFYSALSYNPNSKDTSVRQDWPGEFTPEIAEIVKASAKAAIVNPTKITKLADYAADPILKVKDLVEKSTFSNMDWNNATIKSAVEKVLSQSQYKDATVVSVDAAENTAAVTLRYGYSEAKAEIKLTHKSNSSSGGSSSTTNTVSASTASNGKVALDKNTAKKGNTVTVTVTPDAGYQLEKLTVTDAKGNTIAVAKKGDNQYTFTMPDSKVTITPTFSKIEDTKPSKNGFNDVASSAWYADAVKYVTDKGLMNGTGDNQFSPNASTTRGMLMTVLARYAGEDTTGGVTWYEKGMNWAKANGVSDGTHPTVNITREQLVTMLYRYAGSPKANGSLNSFSDAASVNSYAVNAMQWAVANGIVNGSNGKLNPQNNATRAQVAAILMRFCEMSK